LLVDQSVNSVEIEGRLSRDHEFIGVEINENWTIDIGETGDTFGVKTRPHEVEVEGCRNDKYIECKSEHISGAVPCRYSLIKTTAQTAVIPQEVTMVRLSSRRPRPESPKSRMPESFSACARGGAGFTGIRDGLLARGAIARLRRARSGIWGVPEAHDRWSCFFASFCHFVFIAFLTHEMSR
jgi:hypothetical protein